VAALVATADDSPAEAGTCPSAQVLTVKPLTESPGLEVMKQVISQTIFELASAGQLDSVKVEGMMYVRVRLPYR
jgi:hypothetical protein